MRIRTILKTVLNPQLKTLVKGGLLDDCLRPTSRFQAAMEAVILDKFGDELVAIAQERIQEDEENDKK